MARVAETDSGFSMIPLEIEIRSAEVPDIELIDLPGIIPNPNPEQMKMANDIREIQAQYIRDPSVFLVAVVKASEEMRTNTDLKVLDEIAKEEGLGSFPPRPDWRSETLIVANKMERFAVGHEGWKSITDANDFFQEAREASGEVIFIHPKVHLKKRFNGGQVQAPLDDASFDTKQQYLQQVQEYEPQWLEDVLRELKQDSHETWNLKNQEMFGMARVVQRMSEHWKQKFAGDVPKLSAALHQRIQHLAEEDMRIQKALDATNLTNLRMNLYSFSADFREEYQTFLGGTDMDDTQNRENCNSNEYTVELHGRTYDDEMAEHAGNLECSWILTYDHLASVLKDDVFQLDWSMFGISSYSRSLNVMQYSMLHRNSSRYSDEQISNMAKSMGHGGTVPTNKLVTRLANVEVKKLTEGVEWYLSFLERLFSSYAVVVVDHMTHRASSEYKAIGQMSKFINKLQTLLQDTIRSRLQEVKVQWNKDLQRTLTHSPFEKMSRMLLSLVAIPLDDMVMDFPANKTDDSLPARAAKAVEALKALSESTRNFAFGKLDTADMVKGGFMSARPQDINMLEFDYIRATAFGIYSRLSFDLAENFRASMYSEFISFMTRQTSLERVFSNLVADYYDGTLEELIQDDPRKLRMQLNKTQSELHEAEAIQREMVRLQNRNRVFGGGTSPTKRAFQKQRTTKTSTSTLPVKSGADTTTTTTTTQEDLHTTSTTSQLSESYSTEELDIGSNTSQFRGSATEDVPKTGDATPLPQASDQGFFSRGIHAMASQFSSHDEA